MRTRTLALMRTRMLVFVPRGVPVMARQRDVSVVGGVLMAAQAALAI